MKFKTSLFLSTALISLSMASASLAGDSATIQKLESKIERLERVLDKVVSDQEKQPNIALKPGLHVKTADKAYSFGIDGFVQADAGWMASDITDLANSTAVKRARLGLKGTIEKDWKYRILTDFGDDDFKLVDANVSYTGFKGTKITVGQFKEFYSLEQLMAAKYWTFAEKASMAALTPKRAMGVGITHQYSQGLVSAGLFGENLNKKRKDDEGWAVTGRATYVPIQTDDQLLHLGLSGSYRAVDAETGSVTFKNGGENTLTGALINTGKIKNADHVVYFTPELAANWGSFGLQAEYTRTMVSRTVGEDLSFDGYYAEASYFLTGESRNYKKKKGVFAKVKPLKPFNLDNGDLGAIQVAYRYSVTNLNDGTIRGGKLNNHTVGVNWLPNESVRVSANVIHSRNDENAKLSNENPTLFLLRGQFEF